MPEPVFTDLDRRTIGNLSIPRNVADLAATLEVDPHTPTRPEADVHKHLQALEKRGLVVKLGTHHNAGLLASYAENHTQALSMGDEKAGIFAARVSDPRRRWRVRGDTWMVTNEGLSTLKVPTIEDRAFTVPELEELINRQWEVVQKDILFQGSIHDQGEIPGGVILDPETGKPYEGDDGPTLQGTVDSQWLNPHSGSIVQLPHLLPEEFTDWLRVVLDDAEGRWGESAKSLRKRVTPMFGGAGWTATFSATIIDAENQKSTITAAAPWFMALTILAFTDADTGTTADDGSHKPTYTGYARISVAAADMGSASGAGVATAANANALIGAACTAGSSTVLGFGNCAAATVGLLRKYGTCASTTVSTTQTPPQFGVGAYTTSAD